MVTPVDDEEQGDAMHARVERDGLLTQRVRVTRADGLHLRPATQIAEIARQVSASVRIGNRDARSVLGIVALELHPGDSVEVTVSGMDADEILDRICAILSERDEVESGDDSGPSQL